MKKFLALSLVLKAALTPLRAEETGAPILRPFALMGDPPPVQVIAPGFVVRELPVQLTNINNLVYAPDGRLFAYAYNSNVYLLTDTDGDGLEDKATYYYKNENDELTGGIGMTWGPDGLYLASRKRIVRLRERDDGTAEVETFTSGWMPPDRPGTRYLDVYGIAFDREGNCYFGLGISDIRNAYRLDPDTGQSRYSLEWDRGTIQKVSPDGRREIFATGVRYTVSLAFNAEGDLFASDQEGATWLYNGNPFDELLHITHGRHYGFPPRHPQYLPDVIDEPSVFDYGPQHQSTCGVHFNEPLAENQPVFGPDWWRGDAFVAGSARGRIYRTKLVKVDGAYIARNETLAYLSMLTIDAVPTPQGDLIVACHSGRPDWGTGPTGMGKLYKISYSDRSVPQPVFAHAASPTELRVVFDRRLDPAQFEEIAGRVTVAMGEYLVGGDRFESFRPGYQAVKNQQKAPRYQLPVLSARLDDADHALVLRTAPHTAALNFSIGWRDGTEVERPRDAYAHELRQLAEIAIHADLSGVQATWSNADGVEQWSGWLPHLNLDAARVFTAPSLGHAKLFELLRQPGTLTLKAQLNLYSMLHPAVQPGAKLDYEYPPETVHVTLSSENDLELEAGPAARTRRASDGSWSLTVEPASQEWVPVEISLRTSVDVEPQLRASWSTAEDARPRQFPLHRILLPWASRQESGLPADAPRVIPELAGGDWERGRKLFFGAATCATCHQINGEGGTFGPDLSNLVHRDYASVVEDIQNPSAALNPDYLAVTMRLKNGQTVSGIRVEGTSDNYVLAQPAGEPLVIPRSEVEPNSTHALGMSLMPPGLLNILNEQEQKDLMTYLLTLAPE